MLKTYESLGHCCRNEICTFLKMGVWKGGNLSVYTCTETTLRGSGTLLGNERNLIREMTRNLGKQFASANKGLKLPQVQNK